MAPFIFPIYDLSLELFRAVLEACVRARSVKRALRLRLVCKLFNQELPEIMYAMLQTDPAYLGDIDTSGRFDQVFRPCLEKNLWQPSKSQLPTLRVVRAVAEELAKDDGDPSRASSYGLQLLQLAIDHNKGRYEGFCHVREDDFQLHLLMGAVATNHVPLAHRLLATVTAEKHDSYSVFGDLEDVAVYSGNPDMVDLAIAHDAHRHGSDTVEEQACSTLREAMQSGRSDTVRHILTKYDPFAHLLNRVPDYYETEESRERWRRDQINIFLRTPDIACLEIMLKERDRWLLPDNIKHEDIIPHLFGMAGKKWTKTVRRLVLLGAPLSSSAEWYRGTCRKLLRCVLVDRDLVELMLERGAVVDWEDVSCAACRRHVGSLKLLLNHLQPKEVSADGWKRTDPSLGFAALRGDLEVVRILLDAGFDPNYQNPYRGAALPIIQALESERPDVVQLLVERGAALPKDVVALALQLTEAAGLESMSALVRELAFEN